MAAAPSDVRHPPEQVLRAYGRLLRKVFLFLRSRPSDPEFLFALGDALHNIEGVLVSYGTWTDDEDFRRLYLRPFDRRWGSLGLRLEDALDSAEDATS